MNVNIYNKNYKQLDRSSLLTMRLQYASDVALSYFSQMSPRAQKIFPSLLVHAANNLQSTHFFYCKP